MANPAGVGLAVLDVGARADHTLTMPKRNELGTVRWLLIGLLNVAEEAESVLLDGHPEAHGFGIEPML